MAGRGEVSVCPISARFSNMANVYLLYRFQSQFHSEMQADVRAQMMLIRALSLRPEEVDALPAQHRRTIFRLVGLQAFFISAALTR